MLLCQVHFRLSMKKRVYQEINVKIVYLPTTISVNSKPRLAIFRWTWFGKLAKPTKPDCLS
jgi:hypothetical protein